MMHNKQCNLSSTGRPVSIRPIGRAVALALALAAATLANAGDLSHTVSGNKFDHIVISGDTLGTLSSEYGVDRHSIVSMNELDGKALIIGRVLAMNNRHIIPTGLANGISINLPQRMLYYFQDGQLVAAYPVALGTAGWQTPMGNFKITQRAANKAWYVPVSIQEDMRMHGLPVVKVVPAGADNPLGKYFLRTTLPNIGIHGTLQPNSIYRFESHGCIRLNDADIEKLYHQVKTGTSGRVIYEPVLMAKTDEGGIYLEVMGDAYKKSGDAMEKVHALALVNQVNDRIDWDKVKVVVQDHEGVAINVALNRNDSGMTDADAHLAVKPLLPAQPAQVVLVPVPAVATIVAPSTARSQVSI